MENKALLLEKIDTALENVRKYLDADGGNVEVIDITEDMVVKVKLLGNCNGCSMAQMTMASGIEIAIKAVSSEIKSVIAI